MRRHLALVVLILLAMAGVAYATNPVFPLGQLESYGGSQDQGSGSISIMLTGNSWKSLPFDYTVTENTTLEFDFDGVESEINGVGLDTDTTITPGTMFQLWGTQTFGPGWEAIFDYESGPGHYVIPIGQHFTGTFDRLVFVNDQDSGIPGQSKFSDVQIYEVMPTTTTTTAPTTTTTLTTTTTTSAPQTRVIDRDTLIENETLTLRPGDSIEFRNGARLSIGQGASVDWQGTPTSTWSDLGAVQNLERDIDIFGSGDIRFEAGSLPSTIRFVEIDLQPVEELGRYPLHWHLVGESSRGTLVEGVVIKNSTNRAFVPHGSNGITFLDTIAKNIKREAYWWDPGRGENDSNDILIDRALADGVTFLREDGVGDFHRGSAFMLRSGFNTTLRNSVALNVSGGSHCSGFQWPEKSGSVWGFENNHSVSANCLGIFVWQNTNSPNHLIDGFTGSGIEHGAYKNFYDYRNVTVDSLEIHALGWTMTDSHAGDVVARSHNALAEGEDVVFTNVTFDSFAVFNGKGEIPGRYVINTTNLTCADIAYWSVFPGTEVVIDGAVCPVP